MRLYLIRHPQPIIASGICYGASDLPVAAAECDRLGNVLRARLPHDVPLFSSPLRRCVALAEQLAGMLDCTPQYDRRLAEMHFGCWEMQEWTAIPRAEIDAWSEDLIHYRPGNGESVLQVAQRAQDFIDALSQREVAQAIVVCHAGIMRLLAAHKRGHSIEESAMHAAQNGNRIDYGELLIIET